MKSLLIAFLIAAALVGDATAQPATKADGEMRWALYVTLTPAVRLPRMSLSRPGALDSLAI